MQVPRQLLNDPLYRSACEQLTFPATSILKNLSLLIKCIPSGGDGNVGACQTKNKEPSGG